MIEKFKCVSIDKSSRAIAVTVLSVCVLLGSPMASAGLIGLSFTVTDENTATISRTRGWSFSTSNDITIESLGWWDFGGDGLFNTHEVAIWDLAGSLLMSTTVSAGAVDPLISGFRFNSDLTGSSSLSAGTYVIGGFGGFGSLSQDRVAFAVAPANLTLGAGISFIENRSGSGLGVFSFPGIVQDGLDAGVFGPSFQYEPAAVPAPATLVLFGLGLAGLCWSRRKET